MTVVARGQGGPIRWALDYQGAALDFLTDKNRKELIQFSMKAAGVDWAKVFLPKRFTGYVERHPFPYKGHRLGFYFNKAKRMGIVKGIINRLSVTKGWDPWEPGMPPWALIMEWKKLNPGKYDKRKSETSLVGDMRRNAKRSVMEVIDEMLSDGKFLPLVEKGIALSTALGGFKVRATATNARQTIKIAVPFGHPTNAMVGATVRTLPTWEIIWIAKKLGEHLKARLNAKGLSTGAGGVVTTRSVPAVSQRPVSAFVER